MKFSNLGLTLVTHSKFYTSVAKGLKLKVIKFWGLIRTFVEVTGEKGKLFMQLFWPLGFSMVAKKNYFP